MFDTDDCTKDSDCYKYTTSSPKYTDISKKYTCPLSSGHIQEDACKCEPGKFQMYQISWKIRNFRFCVTITHTHNYHLHLHNSFLVCPAEFIWLEGHETNQVNIISKIQGLAYKKCIDKCKQDMNCKAFEYSKHKRTCLLLKVKVPSPEMRNQFEDYRFCSMSSKSFDIFTNI